MKKKREFAYNLRNIWYNPQISILKDTNFRTALKQLVLWVQSLEMEKTIFPHGDDTEKCCLSLTSVSVSNSKFSFLFCHTLTRSKKKRSWGGVLVRNSRNKASMAKHKCLLWQLLKLQHTSFSTLLIKGFQIGSLNSITDLLKRPSATIHCS